MEAGPVLTLLSCRDDPRSTRLAEVVRGVVRANEATGLRLEIIDVDDSAARARELGLLEYPALVMFCDGVERGRLVGLQSRRAVLHMVLPELHRDPNDALEALRLQLDSAGEQFPRRVLKRHERVGKSARVSMLGRVPLFSRLSKRQLGQVGGAADEVVLDAGSTLLREGDPGEGCFVVSSGSLTVRRGRKKVASIAAGDFVGEMALLDGGPRTATVTADERCVLLALDRATFRGMLEASPDLAIDLLAVMSDRLRAADARLSD